MSKAIIVGLTFILVGLSFMIMSLGFIKNKYVVYAGGLLFIMALVLFLIGFKDVMFAWMKL